MKTTSCHVRTGIILWGAVLFVSVANAAETREVALDADVFFPKRRCVVELKAGVPHGICRAYDDQKRLILTEEYVNGRVEGKRICYYPSGKKFSEMSFVNGLGEGATTTWYENGTVASTDHMRRGQPHGVQTLYYPSGKKSVETPHVMTVTHGTCRHYLPDGRLFGLSTFADGVEVGKRVIIEPTAREYREIVEAGKFSAFLKDHWPSTGKPFPEKSEEKRSTEIRRGDLVEVKWKETWYPATVLRIEKRGYYIHYQGYEDSWDEYVWKDRIRPATK
jgi:hypothetical protein